MLRGCALLLLWAVLACSRAGYANDDAGERVGDASSAVADTGAAGDSGAADDSGSVVDCDSIIISHVRSSSDRVFAGQRHVQIDARVENLSGGSVDLVNVSLRFSISDSDVGSDYVVTPDPGNALQIEAGEGATLLLWVDVKATATAGLVSFDGSVMVQHGGGAQCEVTSARETDSWQVMEPDTLLVTTQVDEDDTGGTFTVQAAGGASDLSLREAILIANTATEAPLIRFDPAVFPDDRETLIDLNLALGALPELSREGMVIDGVGSGEVINGAPLTEGAGLVVLADDVTIQGVQLVNFAATEYDCAIAVVDASRARLLELTLLSSGHPDGGAAAVILGGSGHEVRGCHISNSGYDGVMIDEDPAYVTFADNTFLSNVDAGIKLSGIGHTIVDNRFEANQSVGIENHDDVSGLTVQRNTFLGNDLAIWFGGTATDILIEDNQFIDNSEGDIALSGANVRNVRLSCNVFGHSGDLPVYLEEGANAGTTAPVIDAFDGLQAQGSGVDGAVIDLYSVEERAECVGQATVSAGRWSATLGRPAEKIAALTTGGSGSSVFSAPVVAASGRLIVSTVDDELDGGDTIATVAAAGGATDLSLREALVIANNRLGPDRITFDPAVFPIGGSATIDVGGGAAGLELLPIIGDPGTTVDGTGAGVVIDGGGRQFPQYSGLLMAEETFEVEIRGLTLQRIRADTGGCVSLYDVDEVVVGDNVLQDCGSSTDSAAVKVHAYLSNYAIIDNEITNAYSAIWLYDSDGGTISGNHVSWTADDTIFLKQSAGVMIADNWVHDSGCCGIGVYNDSSDCIVVGNRVARCANNGVWVEDDTYNTQVMFNTLVDNSIGLWVESGMSGTRAINNIFAGNSDCGVDAQDPFPAWTNNLFYGNGAAGLDAYCDSRATAPSDVLADPDLVDAASGDFTPRAAAIDTGLNVGVDRNGEAAGLFNGSAPDIGAVETP